MTNTVDFSFLVPNKGYKESFNKCIASLLEQEKIDKEKYEILICDQSEDSDYNKIKSIINSIKRIDVYLFKSKIKSAFEARQFLIEKARGQYIICVDSDDWVKTDFLFQINEFLNKNNFPDICIFGYTIIKNGKIIKTIMPKPLPSKEEYINHLLYTNELNSTCNKVMKKDLFVRQTCEKKVNEDKILLIPFFINAKKILCDINSYYYYDMNDLSVTHNLTIETAKQSIQFNSKYWNSDEMNYEQKKLFINSTFLNLIYCMQIMKINGNANKSELKKFYKEQQSYLKSYNKKVFTILFIKNKIRYLIIKFFGYY